MKKFCTILLTACLSLISVSLYADNTTTTEPSEFEEKVGWAAEKFTRGLCNVATGLLEIPNQMGKRGETDGPLSAMTAGLAEGLGAAVVRMGAGVWDAISWPGTFIIPDSKPVIEPPTLFDK